jgi:undecaprenyl diphosphate synthase
MDLAAEKLDELAAKKGFLERNRIRVQVIGDLALLPPRVQKAAARAMLVSRHFDNAILNICLSYTSRQEILSACGEVLSAVWDGRLEPDDVGEKVLAGSLYTSPYSQV